MEGEVGVNFIFDATIWRWEARTEDWFFVTVPAEIGGDIAEVPRMRRGFGAVKVEVSVGDAVWRTSIFPQEEVPGVGREYVLPLKRAVRESEGLSLGDACTIALTVVDL